MLKTMALLVLCLGCLIFVNSFSLFRLYYTYLSLPFPPLKFFPIPSLLSFKLIMFYILFFKHMIYIIYIYIYIFKNITAQFLYYYLHIYFQGYLALDHQSSLAPKFSVLCLLCVQRKGLFCSSPPTSSLVLSFSAHLRGVMLVRLFQDNNTSLGDTITQQRYINRMELNVYH